MGRAPGLRLQPSWGSGRDFLPAWGPGHASSHPWTDNAAQLRGPRTLSPPPAPPPRKPGLLAADSVPHRWAQPPRPVLGMRSSWPGAGPAVEWQPQQTRAAGPQRRAGRGGRAAPETSKAGQVGWRGLAPPPLALRPWIATRQGPRPLGVPHAVSPVQRPRLPGRTPHESKAQLGPLWVPPASLGLGAPPWPTHVDTQ